MLSRAKLANPPNGYSGDDEDVSGSSSSFDERDERSDDDDEDSEPYTDRDRQVREDELLARKLGTRTSKRLKGPALPPLHSVGLQNKKVGPYRISEALVHYVAPDKLYKGLLPFHLVLHFVGLSFTDICVEVNLRGARARCPTRAER